MLKLNEYLKRLKTLEFIIKENPLIVMADGSNSFQAERKVSARYPDAHEAMALGIRQGHWGPWT